MLGLDCTRSRDLLLESEGRRIRPEDALWLEAHLETCDSCRQQRQRLGKLLGAWRDETEEPLRASQLARIKRNALERAARASDEPFPTPARRRGRLAVTIAAAAALLLTAGLLLWTAEAERPLHQAIVTQLNRSESLVDPPEPRLSSAHGDVSAPGAGGARVHLHPGKAAPWNAPLRVGRESACLLRLGDTGPLVGLGSDTRATLRWTRGRTHIELSAGTAALDVPPGQAQRLVVAVPGRGEVHVVGTRFFVDVRGTEVSVQVLRGTVQYRWLRDGQLRTEAVERGERLVHRDARVTRVAAGPTSRIDRLLAGLFPAPHVSGGTAEPTQPRRSVTPEPDARSEAGRDAGKSSAELATRQAEAHLRRGRAKRAVRLYLAVAKDHPGTRAAQNALLMAGQVTLSQLSDSRRARTLFRRYL
ncbi:MAG: FecR family protein, partial [bacterium]